MLVRPRPLRPAAVAALAGATVLGAVACGSSSTTASRTAVRVTATDSGCSPSTTRLPAGVTEFAVRNGGSRITEFYVYDSRDQVKGEVENIAPGVTRNLRVELAAGEYVAACKPGMTGDGIRTRLTVTGSAGALAADPALAGAVTAYQAFVAAEADALLDGTRRFADAVKQGDVAAARSLYPGARSHWERIEPVAESFGDLDPAIDARENEVEPGTSWTGYHRLEKDLWSPAGLAPDAAQVADKLVADVTAVVTRAKAVRLSPVQLANGAKELLGEIATGKITGEEERYSHTDLWDFAANLEGVRRAVDALRPALTARDADLLARIDQRYAEVDTLLQRYRAGAGWQPYTAVPAAGVKALADAVNALAEPVSGLAGVVAR